MVGRKPLILLAIAFFLLILVLLSNQIGTCPFYIKTGLYCPGCGALRSLTALSRGDIIGSLASHILVLPLLIAGLMLFLAKDSTMSDYFNKIFYSKWFKYVALTLFVLFWILRNLSGFDYLRP